MLQVLLEETKKQRQEADLKWASLIDKIKHEFDSYTNQIGLLKKEGLINQTVVQRLTSTLSKQ